MISDRFLYDCVEKMLSTDALQVGFLSPPLFINDSYRRVIVNETMCIKTIVLKMKFFLNLSFRFRFFVVVS